MGIARFQNFTKYYKPFFLRLLRKDIKKYLFYILFLFTFDKNFLI